MLSEVNVDPEIMSGTPVFRGTRVPIDSLFQHLRGNYSVDGFLEQFPSVKREQCESVLTEAEQAILRPRVQHAPAAG